MSDTHTHTQNYQIMFLLKMFVVNTLWKLSMLIIFYSFQWITTFIKCVKSIRPNARTNFTPVRKIQINANNNRCEHTYSLRYLWWFSSVLTKALFFKLIDTNFVRIAHIQWLSIAIGVWTITVTQVWALVQFEFSLCNNFVMIGCPVITGLCCVIFNGMIIKSSLNQQLLTKITIIHASYIYLDLHEVAMIDFYMHIHP